MYKLLYIALIRNRNAHVTYDVAYLMTIIYALYYFQKSENFCKIRLLKQYFYLQFKFMTRHISQNISKNAFLKVLKCCIYFFLKISPLNSLGKQKLLCLKTYNNSDFFNISEVYIHHFLKYKTLTSKNKYYY